MLTSALDLATLALAPQLLFAAAAAALGVGCAELRPLERQTLGRRGLRRKRALQDGYFRWLEPSLRALAAALDPLVRARVQARLEDRIARAGDYLGFRAQELVAASLASAVAALAACRAMSDVFASPVWPVLATLVGAAMPLFALEQHRSRRVRAITRRLPATLDLLALGMNAGLDFGAAVELVTRELGAPEHPLSEELQVLLHELSLGHPRKRALQAFAQRTDAPAVFELAAAVIQGEQKGTPLASILETQAQVARNRRSVLAEEAAARASVLLLLPLVLLLGAVLLVLFGPFLLGGLAL